MRRGQAFDAFKLLIAAVIAGAIIVILLNVIGGVEGIFPVDTSQFDATNAQFKDVSVYPPASTQGTVFTVNADVKNVVAGTEKCFAPPKINAVVQGKSVQMYDDGRHNDRKARDCYYGGTVDSSALAIGEYETKVSVEDKLGVTKDSEPTRFNITDNACVTVEDKGSPETKLDIVFVGNGYTDLNKFDADVRAHKDFLLSTPPFDEYRDRISIHEVRLAEDFQCTITDGIIYCDDARITEVAAQCPYDEVIVMLDTDQIAGTANPHAYVTRPYPEITVHEFGHSFGPEPINLADEYAYGLSITSGNQVGDPPNCKPPPCDAGWACTLTDKFGMTGCTYEEWARPVAFDAATGVSVMEGAAVTHRTDPAQTVRVGYDEPSKAHLKKLLEEYQ